MAVSYVGSGTVDTGGDMVPGLPAGIQEGDLLILVAAGYNQFPTVPAGYTVAKEEHQQISVNMYHPSRFMWKIATASETAPTTTSDSTLTGYAIIHAIRDAAATNPISAISSDPGESSALTNTPPSITPTVDGSGIFQVCSYQAASTLSAWSVANGPTLTEVLDTNLRSPDVTIGAAFGVQTTAGPTGTASVALKKGAVNIGFLAAISPHTAPTIDPLAVTGGSSAAIQVSAALIPQTDVAAQATAQVAVQDAVPVSAQSQATAALTMTAAPIPQIDVAAQASAGLTTPHDTMLIQASARASGGAGTPAETMAQVSAQAQAAAAATVPTETMAQVSAIAQAGTALDPLHDTVQASAIAHAAGGAATPHESVPVSAVAQAIPATLVVEDTGVDPVQVTASGTGAASFGTEVAGPYSAHAQAAAAIAIRDGVAIAAQSQAAPQAATPHESAPASAVAQAAAAAVFPHENAALYLAQAQATAAVTIADTIQASATAHASGAADIPHEGLVVSAMAQAAATGAVIGNGEFITISAVARSSLLFEISGPTRPVDYRTSAVRISRSINDAHWAAELQIDKTETPAYWTPLEVEIPDHTDTPQMTFLGLVPGSEYNLKAAENRARSVGYSQTWYLDQQFLTPAQLNMGLADDSGWNDWDDVINDLLGGSSWTTETGIEPYRLRNPGTDYENKRFSFQPKTTKMQAITDIAKFCQFVFIVKPRWTGTEWRSSAYFVDIDDIDEADIGLDLPPAATFTDPDPHVVEIPSVDDLGGDRYNRIIVRGHDAAGVWYTGTVESSTVTAGTALPREYYEESAAHDTQAKCDARATELYSLYNLVCKTARLTLKDRTDLQLLQQIELVGFHGSLDISETYYRIIEITYDQTPDNTAVHITVTPDRLKGGTWYDDAAASGTGDLVSEAEIVAKEETRKVPAGEAGTVGTVNGDIITVDLERGGTIEARAVGTTPQVTDKVFVTPQTDGAHVISGGGGGGIPNPLTEDLDLGGYKIYFDKSEGATDADRIYMQRNSSTGNLIIHLPPGEQIDWSIG